MDRVASACKTDRTWLREMLAEFIGTFLLVFIGDCAVAQSVLSNKSAGEFISINFAYGFAVTLAVLVSGGASGGHVNPAVSVAMALVGKFEWRKIGHYMAGQYLGAFVGAAGVLLVYQDALENFDGGERQVVGNFSTAGIWATYPSGFLSTGVGLADQIVGTFVLLLVVSAITDFKNMKVSSELVPLYVGITVITIGMSLGFNCGYAINPARDLGPRIFTAIAGWGPGVFTEYARFWFVPILGPHIGAVLGAIAYLFIVEFHWPTRNSDLTNEIVVKG